MSGMHRDRLNGNGIRREKQRSTVRNVIRIASLFLFNGYLTGFRNGRIFTGRTKSVCVPVLNCYSCPGALGACPIGSLQAALGTSGGRFPFYVLGTLMIFGAVLGRLTCGLLCPFGLIQDLLAKITSKRITVPKKADRLLRYLKYAVLALFVIILPAFFRDDFGSSVPWFCKYICPAGTLEGGIPLTLADRALREMTGPLFWWKVLLLAAVIAGSVFIERFFCRYLCPLGAFYSLFSRVSAAEMKIDSSACISCGKCGSVCPMSLDPVHQISSAECIMCGRCADICPAEAVSLRFSLFSVNALREKD